LSAPTMMTAGFMPLPALSSDLEVRLPFATR
jgi:hypothetical protein